MQSSNSARIILWRVCYRNACHIVKTFQVLYTFASSCVCACKDSWVQLCAHKNNIKHACLCPCWCMYVRVYVHTFACACRCTRVYMKASVMAYECSYVRVSIYACVQANEWASVRASVRVCKCRCTNVPLCMRIYVLVLCARISVCARACVLHGVQRNFILADTAKVEKSKFKTIQS